MIKKINHCRICKNSNLVPILDLGDQYLTSVFPNKEEIKKVKKYPLKLVKCFGNEHSCNLVQLAHSVKKNLMYGNNYGYRSGLNISMKNHLKYRVQKINSLVSLKKNDIVIDIGSNDGTTLSFYKKEFCRIGIDPTIKKFDQYYEPNILKCENFFSFEALQKIIGDKKAKVITSFAMFYDLDEPLKFAQEISKALDPQDGIWVLEQSYLPEMIKNLSFDTICHEHLEYYCLYQIKWIMDLANLKIVDVEFNDVNGGSFAVTVSSNKSKVFKTSKKVSKILKQEKNDGFLDLKIFKKFNKDVSKFKSNLVNFLKKQVTEKKKVFGIGASTKGNVLLQYCKINSKILPKIGEVNSEKFNKFTPGSLIPIIEEESILALNPDLLIILPWHFKNFFLNNPKYKNFNLLFPLPKIEVIKR